MNQAKNNLTDKTLWGSYWDYKKGGNTVVNRTILFNDIFEHLNKSKTIDSFIEIGGWPGTYSVFVKKFLDVKKVDFIDFVSDDTQFKELLTNNGLEAGDVRVINEDLFNHSISDKYDLVFSNGFIEHFNDTQEVLQKHRDLVADRGHVLILLPNFRGFNGWLQKRFDKKNYAIHNIECMHLSFLKTCMENLGFKDVTVSYSGRYSIWLENIKSKNFLFKFFFKLIWITGKVVSKLLPFESRAFSPYICIIAKR